MTHITSHDVHMFLLCVVVSFRPACLPSPGVVMPAALAERRKDTIYIRHVRKCFHGLAGFFLIDPIFVYLKQSIEVSVFGHAALHPAGRKFLSFVFSPPFIWRSH
jgi:hypothetical protein